MGIETLERTMKQKEKQIEDMIKIEKERCEKTRDKEQCNMLITREPEGFNNVSEETWELIVMYVDSGATETVMTEKMLNMVELKESMQSKRGVGYEVANGTTMQNSVNSPLLRTLRMDT